MLSRLIMPATKYKLLKFKNKKKKSNNFYGLATRADRASRSLVAPLESACVTFPSFQMSFLIFSFFLNH